MGKDMSINKAETLISSVLIGKACAPSDIKKDLNMSYYYCIIIIIVEITFQARGTLLCRVGNITGHKHNQVHETEKQNYSKMY